MKIRSGFVTNSSSSSFIVVGVDADTYHEAFGVEQMEGVWGNKYYDAMDYNGDFEIVQCDAEGYSQYISLKGQAIIQLLEDHSLKEIRALFVEMANKLGADVPESAVTFDYGGYYNG